MKLSLSGKLVLAFLLVAITSAVFVAAFIQLTSKSRLNQMVIDGQRRELSDLLISYYREYQTIEGINAYLADIYQQGQSNQTTSNVPHQRVFFCVTDPEGIVAVPIRPFFEIGDQVPDVILQEGTSVKIDNQVIGIIIDLRPQPDLTPEERLFLARTNQAILLAAIASAFIALLVGTYLASTLTRPLNALKNAASKMAGGSLEQVVTVSSRDEIGELASAFNQMSQNVSQANNLRRQMTADIAHDLRTPLTVAAGYLESMTDGVLQPTPERLAVIYTEIEQLQHLVEDLRTLSRADAGELTLTCQNISPYSLLHQIASAFAHQAEQQEITLKVNADETLPAVWMDESRMLQVLNNLISNAFRYTSSGGTIQLSAEVENEQMVFRVTDNGSGISKEDLPFIFARFYRADPSRNQNTGSSGLGLAIAKAIVTTHRGVIDAFSTPGNGTTIEIRLPIQPVEDAKP